MAFGGLGAALGGFGSLWLGASQQDAMLYALFGALALTAFMQRKGSKKIIDPTDFPYAFLIAWC
jgi:hypothetical protein